MNQEAQEIQITLEQAQEAIADRDALYRLYKNEDFKRLILNGYFREEAVRLVEAKASPTMQAAQVQEALLSSIDAIGGLQQHFNKIDQFGAVAEQTIADCNEALVEIEDATEGGI